MSSDLMTSSLPNMDMTELDKLSDRLGKFKSPSRLPKPEISPKPAYLAAQLAKHKMVESSTESKIGNFYLIFGAKKSILIFALKIDVDQNWKKKINTVFTRKQPALEFNPHSNVIRYLKKKMESEKNSL